MPKSCVQFHASFEELCSLVDHISRQPDTGVAFTMFDWEAKEYRDIHTEDWRGNVSESSLWFARFWLQTADRAKSSGRRTASDETAHGDLNLNAGYINGFGLSETSLGYCTESMVVHLAWAKIIRRVRQATMTGVWLKNPQTNERIWYRNFRFTSGALRLYRDGVRMQQFHQYDKWTPVDPRSDGIHFEPKAEIAFRL